MSKRSERREVERLARKLAYQTQRQHQTQPQPPVEAPVSEPQISEAQVSEAQMQANRANAQKSTGPSTPSGKAKSSRNALKHGLTGQTVLLPHEDPALYKSELQDLIDTHHPATDDELRLVQSIHDCGWRIARVQQIEIGILLKGDLELADKYPDRPAQERTYLIQAESYIKYEKQLRNLGIQEARLRRIRDKDHAELLRLQTLRQREEAARPAQAPAPAPAQAPAKNGFEFSTPQPSPDAPLPQTADPVPNQEEHTSKETAGGF
jgi:hypothetical protein